MEIKERIEKLRRLMADRKIDMYVIPTADFHQSEYVGEHFKARKFITGFSGSQGTAVITKDDARLWTDGRYFLQASQQLEGTGVLLMKMGNPGVPTICEYIKEALPQNAVLGFDGRVVSMSEGVGYYDIVDVKGGKIVYDCDLIDEIWTNRPPLSKEPAFYLDIKYTGETTESKLKRVREAMKKAGANKHILTTLDDICWILNVRGNDIEFFPLLLSYAVITMDKMELYIDETKLDDKIKTAFAKDNVIIHPYNDIYEDIKKLNHDDVVLLDSGRINYALYNNIPPKVKKVDERNPEILFKAVKNNVEIENIRKAQLKDGVAHVRFMKWIKENVGKIKITELSASAKLDEFREQMGDFIRPSFEPIVAFGQHGAIIHYSATEETDVEIKPGCFLLTDTGAGFYEGSTDITRTYALGDVPAIMKEHFTLVLISNLRLGVARFKYGVNSTNVDIITRTPFWERDLDYNHGTGHGVGYLLNIHEGPSGVRWRSMPMDNQPFEAGMVITDEPGLYIDGSHGIRLENELLVVNGTKNEYGQFMHFEPITFIPMDLDAVDKSIMTAEDVKLLNDYHKAVYEKLSPMLNDEEKEWLKKYTREI
ncbi:hypothetical protein HMPREF9333_01026 [Johnsonella ignava ATCC 51276]|uniref:Peptidase M24 n=1 Tax=Johnsonella ignava ATCC 51276 TaxID=679200 RepID=G5GHI6_9FIRM|nr:aminopeptidase P family N-terminal domain-containing protein [Johnsonella ignava]EHI55811.1 hypothetical protein HMPREF9333_01026 [Johnsonella ignava ATCC 51276]